MGENNKRRTRNGPVSDVLDALSAASKSVGDIPELRKSAVERQRAIERDCDDEIARRHENYRACYEAARRLLRPEALRAEGFAPPGRRGRARSADSSEPGQHP